MAGRVSTDLLRKADQRAVRDANQSGALTRLFHRATAGYRKALGKDATKTLLLTAAVVLGIPMAMEAIAFGIMPHTYLGMTMDRMGRGMSWLQSMRELAIRECGLPFLAILLLTNPGGWAWGDLQSLTQLQIGTTKPHAKFDWLPPQIWLSKALTLQKSAV